MKTATLRFACFVLNAVMLTALFFASPLMADTTDQPLKVGFITNSAIDENHGWNYSHNLGRLALEEHFGDQIQTAVFAQDNVADDLIELVIRGMLEDGFKMFFFWDYGFEEFVHQLAREFPDVVFEVCTGRFTSPNVATYSARFYEGRFVAGVLAARTSSTGKLGYIGSVPIPEVLRGINAYTLGARTVNPEAEVLAVMTHSWSDPQREEYATYFLAERGADVIITHTDAVQTLVTAERIGVYAFGKASDMGYLAPNAHIAAVSNDWGGYYINRVNAMIEGRWESADVWGGANGPAARLTHLNQKHIDTETIELVEKVQSDVLSGEIHPFAGPIYDIEGNLAVGESDVLPDSALLDMNWLVQGVIPY